MKRYAELIIISACLVVLSAVIFALQWRLFHDSRDMEFYLLQDLAFLPIQMLLVAVIVERFIDKRERGRRFHKLNMVIGIFFNELGVRLLGEVKPFLANYSDLRPLLAVHSNWDASHWKNATQATAAFDFRVDLSRQNLAPLRDLLSERRNFLTLLLANPNLMEHEEFTEMLWAVSHLMEELAARPALDSLPPADLDHLAGDIKRVYAHLTVQWLLYCRHLQKSYPYIFSIIVRTHPLQDAPSPVVR